MRQTADLLYSFTTASISHSRALIVNKEKLLKEKGKITSWGKSWFVIIYKIQRILEDDNEANSDVTESEPENNPKKPPKCRFSDCNAIFAATADLNNHTNLVHGTFKGLGCECGRWFSSLEAWSVCFECRNVLPDKNLRPIT